MHKHTSLRSSWKVLEQPPQVPWQLKCQTASAGGWGLRTLHCSWTLLSLLQLVVLKQSFISRNTVSSIWECQQACRQRHGTRWAAAVGQTAPAWNGTYRIPQPGRLWILLQISSRRIGWRFHCPETSPVRIHLHTWHKEEAPACHLLSKNEKQKIPLFLTRTWIRP